MNEPEQQAFRSEDEIERFFQPVIERILPNPWNRNFIVEGIASVYIDRFITQFERTLENSDRDYTFVTVRVDIAFTPAEDFFQVITKNIQRELRGTFDPQAEVRFMPYRTDMLPFITKALADTLFINDTLRTIQAETVNLQKPLRVILFLTHADSLFLYNEDVKMSFRGVLGDHGNSILTTVLLAHDRSLMYQNNDDGLRLFNVFNHVTVGEDR